MGETNIRDLSRSKNCIATYTVTEKSSNYPHLYEAITAGALQRIADSMETIAATLTKIEYNQRGKEPSKYLKEMNKELRQEIKDLNQQLQRK